MTLRPGDITDEQIPTAPPDAVVQQYSPLVKKIANRYHPLLEKTGALDCDDLLQVGFLALLKAQENYDPAGGASFLSFSQYYIRSAMRRELGFSSDGRPPEETDYLDRPIGGEDDDIRLIDTVADDTPTAEENTIDQDSQQETVNAVRAAVNRLKSEKQREIITRVWLNGQDRESAAADMGMKVTALRSADMEARSKLKRDFWLRQYAVPFFHVGREQFNTTWTSAVELAVIWKEEHLPKLLQPAGEELS